MLVFVENIGHKYDLGGWSLVGGGVVQIQRKKVLTDY